MVTFTRGKIVTLDYTDYTSQAFSQHLYGTTKGLLDYKATVIWSYLNWYKQQ